MANRNTVGFGLIAQGTVGSTDAAGGQGKYYIDAAYAVDLFQGSVVQSKVGYIKTAQAAITNTSIGILNGIFYNASTTQKPTWANWYNQPITPANSEDVTAFVIDNPLQLFSVSADAAIVAANYGRTCGVTVTAAGSEISGQSSSELTIGTIHDTNNQWRVLRSSEDPENSDTAAANSTVIVCQNLNQYLTNAVTWQ
jgi:hypothetical protein